MNSKQSNAKISLYFATFFVALTSAAIANSSIVSFSGQKIMMESETGKSLMHKLQEKQKELATPLQAEQKKIQDLEKKLIGDKEALDKDYADLEKNAKMMPADAREQKADSIRDRAAKFEDMKRDFDRKVQKFQADAQKIEAKMSETYQKEMTKFDALVKEVASDLGKKHNYDLIVVEESVVFCRTSINEKIIEEVDRRTKAANMLKKEAAEKNTKSSPTKDLDKIENKISSELGKLGKNAK